MPYFLLYNYEDKLRRYREIRKKNKELPEESKISSNGFNSPSPMNELCDYISRWENKNILWDRSQSNTKELLLNKNIPTDNTYLLRQFKKLNADFCVEWKKLLKERDGDETVNLDKCLNRYRDLILGFSDDRKMIANYFIRVAYSSIDTNKVLCWYTFGNEMIENLIGNTPEYRINNYVEVKNPSDAQYEYLGKYYKEE